MANQPLTQNTSNPWIVFFHRDYDFLWLGVMCMSIAMVLRTLISAHSFAAMGANHIGQIEVGVMSGLIGAGNTLILGGGISLFVIFAIWQFMPGIKSYRYNPNEPFEGQT